MIIIIYVYFFRRRSLTPPSKPTPSPSTTNTGKKNVSSPTSITNTTSKSGIKSPDKAPLLEQTIITTAATTTKRRLVPERTVQISDVNTSRFKTTIGGTITTGQTSITGKETSSASSEAAATSAIPSAIKPVLTAADSGIYGADLSDDVPPVTKSITSVEPPKIYGIDLPDKSESTSPVPSRPVTVVVNPLSENPPSPLTSPENTTLSTIVVSNNVPTNILPDEKEVLLDSFVRNEHLDETVKSAYSHLIDATMSENEGAIGGGSMASSASQSRRTSNVKQPLLSHETNNIEITPRKATSFNPLHMILKKDANKYYTTEYI